jgi:lysozyme family protein
MKENFEQCFALVLKHEGGYVDHPKDPGGATNLGCTKAAWEAWVGRTVTKDEIKALKPADVMPLYRKKYWDAVRGDELPEGVDYAVFDLAINSGPSRAIKILQSAANVPVDGVIGPATLAAVRSIEPVALSEKICDNRNAFLQNLSTYSTFGKGWSRRVSEVRNMAANMVG